MQQSETHREHVHVLRYTRIVIFEAKVVPSLVRYDCEFIIGVQISFLLLIRSIDDFIGSKPPSFAIDCPINDSRSPKMPEIILLIKVFLVLLYK